MNTQPTFGFIVEYVSDLQAGRRFYEEVMGLRAVRTTPFFVEFGSFAIASDEPMRAGSTHETFWFVTDASRALDELSRVATIVLPLTVKPFGKVFGVSDAQGHPQYLLERTIGNSP
jgi:Lactoylglutathione lyase and related lyases